MALYGFFENGVARRFFLPSLPVADNIHNSRSEAVSYTNYGLHTADFAAGILNYSRPRPRLELLVMHLELVLLQRTAAATARAATATTIEQAALVVASVDERARKNLNTTKTATLVREVSTGQWPCRDEKLQL